MSDEPNELPQEPIGPTDVASAAHTIVRFSFGMPSLALSGALLSFVIGIGLTDVAADFLWPGGNNAGWIRLAGGVAALVAFFSAIKWRSRWSWPKIVVAIVLFPVLVLAWAFSIYWLSDPRPDPIRQSCIAILAVIVLCGTAAWIVNRRFERRKQRE